MTTTTDEQTLDNPDNPTDPDPAPALDTTDPDPAPADRPPAIDTDELAAENARLRDELHAARMAEALRVAGELAQLHDPADVIRYTDPADLTGPDGMPDPDRVATAALHLAAARPYLRRVPAPPTGTADGGTRGQLFGHQLQRHELAGMSPEDIVEARRRGLLDDMLGYNR